MRKTENHHQNNTIFFLQASSIKWMPKLVAKVLGETTYLHSFKTSFKTLISYKSKIVTLPWTNCQMVKTNSTSNKTYHIVTWYTEKATPLLRYFCKKNPKLYNLNLTMRTHQRNSNWNYIPQNDWPVLLKVLLCWKILKD